MRPCMGIPATPAAILAAAAQRGSPLWRMPHTTGMRRSCAVRRACMEPVPDSSTAKELWLAPGVPMTVPTFVTFSPPPYGLAKSLVVVVVVVVVVVGGGAIKEHVKQDHKDLQQPDRPSSGGNTNFVCA